MYRTVGFNIFEANLDELIYGAEAAELRAEYRKISRGEKTAAKDDLDKKPFQKKHRQKDFKTNRQKK